MTTHPRTLAVGLAAVVVTALGSPPLETRREPATQAPLPRLGHWRNDHPGDNTRPVGWLERMQEAERVYGPFEGHWRHYHAPGAALPMTDQEVAAAESGQPLHISWKPRPEGEDWAFTASGAYDDTIDRVMADLRDHCGPDCWLSVEIEPEAQVDETPGSGFTTADFRGLWERVAASRDRTGADNVSLVWVVQGYEDWRPLYPDLWPGNDLVDIVGHDPYVRKDEPPERLAEKMVDRTRWLVENSTPEHDYAAKPFLIAEFGCDVNNVNADVARGTGRHRVDCIEGVVDALDDLAELGVVEMSFYDARSNRLDDPPAADGRAYQELKEVTETRGR